MLKRHDKQIIMIISFQAFLSYDDFQTDFLT